MDPVRPDALSHLDDDDFEIKGKATQSALMNSVVNKDAPQDTCVICLERVSERAVAVPCNHLNFDFLCLASWLQEQPYCPLCKSPTTQIHYDWRSPEDYEVYRVPDEKERAVSAASNPRATPTRAHHRFPRRGNGSRRFPPLPRRASPDNSLSFRRRVYMTKSYSLHVGANRVSEYTNFTPSVFASSAHLQSRARMFMRRDFQAFDYLQHPNIEFLIEYMVAILKKIEIRGAEGAAQELVAEFLGAENSALFLHELESWLRSPYERLDDWDSHVQYASPLRKPSGGAVGRGNVRPDTADH